MLALPLAVEGLNLRPTLFRGLSVDEAARSPLAPLVTDEEARRERGTRPIHLRIDGKWYDATGWADRHPGGRYVLEWADGYDVTNAFHTIHLFGGAKARNALHRLPPADLAWRERREAVLPPIERVAGNGEPTGMDRFMWVGEKFVQLASPPAAEPPAAAPAARRRKACRGSRRRAARPSAPSARAR